MKTLRHLTAGALVGLAYIDMVAACFATAMGLRGLALELVASGMLLVVGAFGLARDRRG